MQPRRSPLPAFSNIHGISGGLLLGLTLVAAVVLAAGIWLFSELRKARAELATATAAYEAELEARNAELAQARHDAAELEDALEAEQNRNEEFEDTLDDLSGTVGTLEKLAKTDPELLAKYSKVYFLNENYVPSRLSRIDPERTYNEERVYEFHADALPFLEDLLDEATEDGIAIEVVSAYRSFGEQSGLKASYRVTYGSAANRFSADQGYSEHQLGTTVDFTTPALGTDFTSFDSTDAYAWLLDNAHEFGFILSYPEGNGYYMYEPWHWRFVGKELAEKLHEDGLTFYDLDQRAIDPYLANLFDD